jgi:hypothetical protein
LLPDERCEQSLIEPTGGGTVTTGIEMLQDIADTAEREKDKHGNNRDRLNLTIFLHDDDSVRIYTSQAGSHGDVRAVEPVQHCSNRFEATGALAEILRMIKTR